MLLCLSGFKDFSQVFTLRRTTAVMFIQCCKIQEAVHKIFQTRPSFGISAANSCRERIFMIGDIKSRRWELSSLYRGSLL